MMKHSHADASDQIATPKVNSSTLETVKEQFIAWRNHRKRGDRIPESLWSQALSLSDTYSVAQIIRILGLGWESYHKRLNKKRGIPYQPKKRKCKLSQSQSQPQSQPQPSFIELKVSETDLGTPTLSHSPCLIELANPSGGRLRIYASAASFLDINCLIDKFFSSQD